MTERYFARCVPEGAVVLDAGVDVGHLVDPELAATIGPAFFSTAAKFRALFDEGFDELTFVAAESFTGNEQTPFLGLTAEVQGACLTPVEASASAPESIGPSEHFLFVGRRAS